VAGRSRTRQAGREQISENAAPLVSKTPGRLLYLAEWIARETTYRNPTLLWLTEWGIWHSSENWHLYYRLRHTYGDYRLLHEAPGHLCLEYEAEDLATFLQLSFLNGWGGYVLTGADYVNAFFSHDEFIDFFAGDDSSFAELRRDFANELKS
jgi:hypothetical protein